MKKLLPIVFLVALGLFFNLDSFAQRGSKVNVANNNELIKALENPNVTSIVITQDGYYDAIDNTAFEGNVIVKSGNGRGANSCTLSITKTDACFVSTTEPNFATAATSGDPSCPDQPDATSDPTNLYGWSVYTSAGTGVASFDMTAMADRWDYNAVFNVTASGKFTLTYKWDAFNETTINVYIYDTPEITITNSATSCEDILFTYTYDFGFSAAETFVTWTITDDASTTVDVTPNSNPASEVTAATFNFDPAAFPTLSTCGAYTLNVISSNSTGCGTNDNYNFYLYDTPTGVTAGSDQTEVCEVAPNVYSTSVTGGFTTVSCGNGATPGVAWTHTGGTGAGTITFGTATDNTTTVSSDACGEYTLTYTVTNGDCSASDEVTVTFVALPTMVNAGTEQDVCEDPTNGYVADLSGSFTEALCSGSSTVMWTQYSGPVTATITNETTLTPHISTTDCGTYIFQMDVTNGTACSVSSTVTVDFYDLATNLDAGADQEICEDASGDYIANLLGSYTDVTCGSTTIEWTATTVSGLGTLSFDNATINNPVATATACGEFLVTYTITTVGATGCSVSDNLTLNFFDLANNVDAGADKDVCSLTTTLTGTYDPLSCGTQTVLWSKISGTGAVIFSDSIANTTTVTTDECGEYIFEFDVINAGQCTVSNTITVFFTDEPTFVKDDASYPIPDTICGYTSNEFYLSYTADCMSPTNSGTFTAETGNATITETGVGTNMWIAALGTGDVCGDYDFKYTVLNGVCTVDTTITITFFESPDLTVNTAGDVYTCSTVTYDVTNAACIVSGQVIDYVWNVTGGTLSVTTGTTVDVTWDMDDATDGYIAVTGTINGTDNGVCDATDDLTVDKKRPTIEGQIKYWNAFETYMPTPFPTNLYGTYPEDYFYVTLYHNGMTHMDSIATVYVQPRLMEDLNELMSYFDFEINTATYGCNAEYIIKVWDGGLVYHNNPAPPANSPTYLGASYTYNEWGGVNATDAYAIQLMASGSDLNASYPWIGLDTDNPAYGYYSNDIADVNTSGSTITALDALIVNYRAVGLLGSYPNAGSNQFSPNFTVTGRMADATVTSLPFETWSTYFDTIAGVADVDVPFSHSGDEYMYFDDAVDHKYTSENLPWEGKANFINIYYEAEGDVNASYIPTSAGFKAQPAMELIYENLVGTQVDDVITIPVSVDRNAEVNAISLFLNYRNDLIEVIGTNYADENVFINQEEGILNIGWFSTDTRAVEEGEIIAQIQIRVLAEIPEGTELFELAANTELADVEATPISNINLKTIGVTTDKVVFTGTELVASNYPNPLKNSTTITYTLPESGKVNVTVLNNMGVVVKTLVAEVQEAGVHSLVYNVNVEAGIYFYSITLQGETNTFSTVERMIVVN